MSIYITSDLHFGHNKPFLYEPRGFSSIEEHDEAIIERWNSVVKPEDTVYILGDLMLNNNEHGVECLHRLNGIKNVIRGNHDTDTRIDLYMYEQGADIAYCGEALTIKYKGKRFYLSHFPTITTNDCDPHLKVSQMTFNLFGHTHQQTNFYLNQFYMYHVGMDSHNCYPVLLDDIIEEINQKMLQEREHLHT